MSKSDLGVKGLKLVVFKTKESLLTRIVYIFTSFTFRFYLKGFERSEVPPLRSLKGRQYYILVKSPSNL